ncbi:MAG: CTP synthase (glutamine hydrolyzing) [Nanoarchaeota archaeon]|nr:CTP synthase (glutamine hydrolyzing) [Nanoarchaeota archaeon]
MLKFIVITGGVLSGLGKGIAAASIGHLLSSRYKVIPIKCDGYLNVDPGTMNPTEHGEVFVLDDGGEVDMDFGHYERFLNITCKSKWNITMGKVFNEIREKERRGDYLGKTVQYVPHVTNLIKEKFFEIAKEEDAEIVLIEIGGTVGDMENELYLEAARQLKNDVGNDNVLYVHLTYVPIPFGANEQKSKPTQQSVHLLLQRGVQPNIIIGRCSEYLDDRIKEKIAQFCNIGKDAVITGLDVDDIYKIPIVFEQEGIVDIIGKNLNLEIPKDTSKWKSLVREKESAKDRVSIALCGKYTRLEDSYASVIEALNHCSANLGCKVDVKWVDTTDENKVEEQLKGVDGIIVPGGFGSRGAEGKIRAVRYARERNVPYLGLCFGLQLAVIEFARDVCGLENANSTEIDSKTAHPVVDILPEQKTVREKGGTMRLGAYTADVMEGSKVFYLYNSAKVSERHRHRYEVNPEYHKILEDKGLVFSGTSQNGKLVEFIELPSHDYFVATQAHPELKSKLEKPAPLFYGFVKACMK